MTITFELPPEFEATLREQFGDLSAAAKEAFLVHNYEQGKLSLGQVAQAIGKGVLEAQQWLGERTNTPNYSVEDLEEDRASLAKDFPELRQ